MKLRKLFAGVAAAATLFGGLALGATTANAADADASATLTLRASNTTALQAADLTAYRIGSYSNLQYDADGKVSYVDVTAANDAVKNAAATAATALNKTDLGGYPDWVSFYAAQSSYAADLTQFAAELVKNPGADAIKNPTISEDGLTATFNNLESGWYLIKDANGNAVFVGTQAFNGNNYVDFAATTAANGVAYLKPTGTPAPGKTATQKTITVGDVIDYELTGKIPNWNGKDSYNYNFVDTPSDSLKINDKSVKVEIGGVTVYDDTATTPITHEGVTVTYPTADVKTLTIAIDAMKFTVGDAVEIDYKATAQAEPGNGQYVNDAKITGTVTSGNTEVTVKTTPFQFTKINAQNDGIDGVGFTIAPKAGTDTPALPANYNATVKSSTVDGEKGVVRFAGLADGTYTVTEDTPLAGYMNVTATFDVKIADGVATFTTTATSDPYNLVDEDNKTVLNVKSATELPLTGAAGTALFTMVGLLLAAAAGTVFVKSRSAKRALRA
ncbi:isopeptide-forming domain-containing fimbrial protein [Bifidobacterium aerophilum]|uniref:Isopeptide-forming domain-containing fimbrial protein n=1 Tax=Bifidobacterium aerophilum TaxID=1798155 RepID=A0A6N9Z455_9BIFI|nr:isopeptide-forming domain-containing fimbrial protein [Bifidobacterium aerophilum]NEG89449.1 isopeptide-forming domain-containing fimbrial protein [Bifidobacterium aerophilum]